MLIQVINSLVTEIAMLIKRITDYCKVLLGQSSLVITVMLLITILTGPILILSRISDVVSKDNSPSNKTEIFNSSKNNEFVKEGNITSNFQLRNSNKQVSNISVLPLFISSLKVSSFSIITCGTFALMAAFIFFTFGGTRENRIVKSIMELLIEIPNLTIALFALVAPVMAILYMKSIEGLYLDLLFGLVLTLSIFPALYLPIYKFVSKVEHNKTWILRRGAIVAALRGISECFVLAIILFTMKANGLKIFKIDEIFGFDIRAISGIDKDLMLVVFVGVLFLLYVAESIAKKKEILEG